ncbi:MAG: hypothetical protein IKI12_05250, partial [Lachnospiraceae bacterium]|nr:hypothetical protein [Lachnospiraceae bacterium]MBR7015834.1 hypothetical protein [Lachnospiraceae bacterium]
MKRGYIIKKFAFSFFAILGVMFTVFVGYMVLSPNITTPVLSAVDFISIYLTTVMFTLSRFVLYSDILTLKMNLKIRLFIGLIPAAAASFILSYHIGLHNLLHPLYEGISKSMAVFLFAMLVLISFLTVFFIWVSLVKRMQKQADSYNDALKKYKEKQLKDD